MSISDMALVHLKDRNESHHKPNFPSERAKYVAQMPLFHPILTADITNQFNILFQASQLRPLDPSYSRPPSNLYQAEFSYKRKRVASSEPEADKLNRLKASCEN